MSFDPIQDRRNQKYTRQELTEFFKGSGAVAQRLKRENPPKYEELRRSAEEMGIVGPSLIGTPAPNVSYKPPTRSYSAEELVARGQYSEAAIRAYFNSKESSDEFHSDRNEYERKREAGVSYGLFTAREVPYIPTKTPAPEWTMRISDELAAESNLPVGTVVNSQQLEQLCQLKVERARQAQEAVAAKVAQDRATEVATLTAKQAADQEVRNQKQRDLDRLVELTTPKPNVTPEPTALATARAIAQERAKQAE